MNDATIEDVTGLLGYIEGHVDFARDAIASRDRAKALAQLEEIQGWADAAVEAVKADNKPAVFQTMINGQFRAVTVPESENSDPPALDVNDKTDPLHPNNYGRSK